MHDAVSSIFKASVQQTLGALKGQIKKSDAYARRLNIEDSAMLSQRIFPDMFAAPRQVQIACDTAARGAARLAAIETMPSFPDTEQTFADLIARCDKSLDYVMGADAAKMDANENVTLQIPMGQQTMPMTGRAFLQGFILPNLHFHAAMFYALMRRQGVPLGKMDFLVPG